jgi:L-threonylcarbamoyladenylate synthase
VAAAGQSSIGLRCPSHPAAQALLSELRKPADGVAVAWGLAAPSANRFGRVSPTTAAHVQSEFLDVLGADLTVLDGGPCEVGIESTIVDCTRGAPVLLRPGGITSTQVEAACGRPLVAPETLQAQGQQAPRASGTLASHYAPTAQVRLMDGPALQQALNLMADQGSSSVSVPPTIAVYARTTLKTASPLVALRRMPSAAQVTAHELFSVLRELDALRVKLIWVETPPADLAWDGVRDRLQRAAA